MLNIPSDVLRWLIVIVCTVMVMFYCVWMGKAVGTDLDQHIDCGSYVPAGFGHSRQWCLLNQQEASCKLLVQTESRKDLPVVCEKYIK